jgi:ribosomal protein L12E/L44/L45/RPP1/RPP2
VGDAGATMFQLFVLGRAASLPLRARPSAREKKKKKKKKKKKEAEKKEEDDDDDMSLNLSAVIRCL